jgi:hypothetical protein
MGERYVLQGELTAAPDEYWETPKLSDDSDLTSLKGLLITE